MSTPLTTQKVMQMSPELLKTAIDERITKVRPMATPIDQISRLAGSRRCGSMEVAYYTVDSKGTETQVSAPTDMSNQEMQGDAGKMVTVRVDDISIFGVSDTVMFPDHQVSEGVCLTAYVNEVMEGKLSLSFTDDYRESFKKGDRIVRMGRAAAELDVQTPQFNITPTRQTNFCQIFKSQVEQSTILRLADKEAGWTLSEQEEAAVIDMRLGMEKNFIFGKKARIIDLAKNEYVYMTGGIWGQAGKTIRYDVNNDDAGEFIKLTREVFTGNNGSRKRLLIGGSKFVENISRLKFNEKVVYGAIHSKWGLETREIVTNFGSLYLFHSEIFDQCGHVNDAMVIDQNFLNKYSHIPFKPEKLDLRAAGARNSDAVVLTEASCLVLRNPEAHCRILGSAE